MNNLISVVIPTYNRADDLLNAIESVLNQTYECWELLIIDNYSTDNTRENILNMNDARIIFLEIQNQGVIAASRNLGIKHSKGKYVAFLDSDDTWENDKLAKSVFWLNKGYDVVYHDMEIITGNPINIGFRKFRTRQLVSPVFNDLIVKGNTLPTSSVVVRKTILDQVKGFRENEDLIAGEDYDLWIRLSEHTQGFKRVEGVLGRLMKGNNNEFSANRLLSTIRYIESNFMINISHEESNKAYARWINYSYGRSYYTEGNYDAAYEYLIKVLMTSQDFFLRIKSVYMLLMIIILKKTLNKLREFFMLLLS